MFAAGTSLATVTFDADLQQVGEGQLRIYNMVVDSENRPHIMYHDLAISITQSRGRCMADRLGTFWEGFDLAWAAG